MTTTTSADLTPIDLTSRLAALEFLPDRRPGDDLPVADRVEVRWSDQLADYRDGDIYIVHYAGSSEWERHPADELVMVVDGATTMTLAVGGEMVTTVLVAMQLLVVPSGVWHRFDSPDGVRVLTVTPQPTDYRFDDPV